MLKIGLTGGIGSGKTAIAKIFNILGIPVFDADKQAKLLMEQGDELIASIRNTFGEKAYIRGKLNRPYLADIVFKDTFKLDQLNALVHPVAIQAAARWMSQQNSAYIIKEAALMFEAGSASNLDYIMGVHAPHHLRVKRVMDRDGVAREQVLTRMSHQIDEGIKMKLCDFIIVNDEQEAVIPQVLLLHDQFIQLSKKRAVT